MNPHSIAESVRLYMQERLPGIPVHTALDNGGLRLPYLLVQATADSEIVPGNATWELTLALELNAAAPDFHLYALRLTLLDRAEVQDDSFVQHASLRAVAQF